VLEEKYGIKPGKFLISATKHYSWPKGGGKSLLCLSSITYCRTSSAANDCGLIAITGIGSENFVDIQVDEDARMCVKDLKRQLDKCLDQEIPVFGAVAIIGSTEHGACDHVAKMLKVRAESQARGLSFAIHCDAAWGGYFASMFREVPPVPEMPALPYVPPMTLQPYTEMQLKSLRHADSITIDPHK
jgi:glutamate/tyrosine decarboxylase-like PLP-dependent enzyme